MHKCIVCGNKSYNTIVNRPEVTYHGIPRNAYMRRKWLKVIGIDRCHDWQRVCSDHFLEENYKPGKKRFLFPNAIPQPYNQNGFLSNYATQRNDVETGNNVILPMEQNIIKNLAYHDECDCIESEFYREKHTGNTVVFVVNKFKSPKWSSRLTRNNEDMSNKNMPDHTSASGLRCSVKNCFNTPSKNLSFFGYPKDLTLRKKWIEKCGLKIDPSKIVMCSTRVCSIHFEINCFKNTELKNRLKPGAVPTLFLDNAPNALSVSIDEVPVLSTICEDQFISLIDDEAAEQLTGENQNNVKDNTSMTIDLTVDDSSDSSSSITLKPIAKRTSPCIVMDDSSTVDDFTRDERGIILRMSKEVALPSIYWKCEYLNAKNATRFCQRNTDDVTVKTVYFYNNLVPTIEVFGKKYEFTTPITTMKELDNLLEKVDSIEKCYGRRGFVFKECLGYFENSLVNMCSGCQGLVKDQDFQRIRAKLEAYNKNMESFQKIISEKKEIVLKLRREMAETKRNKHSLTLKPPGISNIMKP